MPPPHAARRIRRAAVALGALLSVWLPAPATDAAPAAYAFYRVQPGDTLSGVAARFGADPAAVARLSGLGDPDLLRVGERLTVPLEAGSPFSDMALLPRFFWPLRGRITSGFGPRWGRPHEGLDIAAATGTPIRAAAPGVVAFAGWRTGYGRVVVVAHSFGLTTVYAHASAILVRVGEVVGAGQPMARVGATGDATGPHLHFEVRVRGVPVDPLPLLSGEGPAVGRALGRPDRTVC